MNREHCFGKRPRRARLLLRGALLSAILLSSAARSADLLTDYAAARQFLGGRPAKIAFSNGTSIYLVDLSVDPLVIKTVCGDGATDYRAVNISPDGMLVAYSVAKKSYVRRLEENSSTRLEVGDGEMPSFWIHPQTGVWYVIFVDKTTTFNTFTRSIDPVTLTTTGSVATLIDAKGNQFFMQTGGRSPDGRFMSDDDNSHGTIELADPLATAGATVKTFAIYTSYLGWRGDGSHLRNERYAGWCNANISPAFAGNRYYGCVQHMGSEHTDWYVRTFPTDPSVVKPVAPDNSYVTGTTCQIFTTKISPSGTCIIDGDEPMLGVKTHDGNTHFHGTYWSTHPGYVCGKEGGNKNDGSWFGYLYDISDPGNVKYLKVLSKTLNKGNDFLNLWVKQDGAEVSVTRPVEGAAFSQGTNVDIVADGYSIGATVASIEFFVDGASLSTDTSAPFAATWSSATAGNHVLTAKLTDSKGATATSYPVNILVKGDREFVKLAVSPREVTVPPGGSVAFTARATDQYGDALSPQPQATWSVAAGGTVGATGTFTAGGAEGGPYLVVASASSGGVQRADTARVRVSACADDFSGTSLGSAWEVVQLDGWGGGGASLSDGKLRLVARGTNVSKTETEIVAVARPMAAGDFDISVKVASLSNPHRWAKTGLICANDMSDLTKGGMCLTLVTPDPVNRYWLYADAQAPFGIYDTQSVIDVESKVPCWHRLTRSGNTFAGYYKVSVDAPWVAIGDPLTIPGAAAAMEVGLYATSHNTSSSVTVDFDDFACNAGPIEVAPGTTVGRRGPAARVRARSVGAGSIVIEGLVMGQQVVVYDMHGRGVARIDPARSGDWTSTVRVNGLAAGTYAVRVTGAGRNAAAAELVPLGR